MLHVTAVIAARLGAVVPTLGRPATAAIVRAEDGLSDVGHGGQTCPITVVICAQNEELNLGHCLASVAWAEQVIVVDGGSRDSTPAIASALGAEVVVHPWEGYAVQKNWALDNLPIRHEWVLFLDADERVSTELAQEIASKLADSCAPFAGYYVARRFVFMGRWLRRCFWYPDYNLRLFRRDRGLFESRLVHETVVLDGAVGYLTNDLIHDDQRDLATYISRLNRYSSLEAQEIHEIRTGLRRGRIEPAWRGTWGQRRRALKERVWYRLPFRALVRFVWTIFIKRGFLDGREGLIFTILACITDWQAQAKVYELGARHRLGLSEPTLMPELSPPGERSAGVEPGARGSSG